MIIELIYQDETHTIPNFPPELADFRALVTTANFKTNIPENFTLSYTTSEHAEEIPLISQQDYQNLLSINSGTTIKVFVKDNAEQINLSRSSSSSYGIIDEDSEKQYMQELIQNIPEIEIIPKIRERSSISNCEEQDQNIRKIVKEILQECLPSIIAQVKEVVLKELRSTMPALFSYNEPPKGQQVQVKENIIEENKTENQLVSSEILNKKSIEEKKDLALFGHTVTKISKNRVVLFGGATGSTEKYLMTAETFLFDQTAQNWRKIKPSGSCPCPRAAHAATAVETDQLVIYGGSTGGGNLARDDLHLLDLREGEERAQWTIVPVVGPTPGRRYGHTLVFNSPYIILFGSIVDNRPTNDTWRLNVTKTPFSWEKVECFGELPSPRLYHSASICLEGTAKGMMVIFGGRSASKAALNDAWGLRRHHGGKCDWVKAPYNEGSEPPIGRYLHTAVFLGSQMLIVGGRTANAQEETPLETYACDTSEWRRFDSVKRFRHSSWLSEDSIYVFGGFEHSLLNIPAEKILKIHVKEYNYNKIELLFEKNVDDIQVKGNIIETGKIESSPTKNETPK